ncbi:MAG: amidase, partial [Bryobacteraceae bacterium]
MSNHLTLAQMAALIRARELSPVDLVEAHLRQIDRHNSNLNAFVRVLGDEAMETAQKAARESPGDMGPLHG